MVNGIDNVMIVIYPRPLNFFKAVRIMTIFTARSCIIIDAILMTKLPVRRTLIWRIRSISVPVRWKNSSFFYLNETPEINQVLNLLCDR